MYIEDLTEIYSEETMQICRTLLSKGMALDDDVTTPLKAEVNIRTLSHIDPSGMRRWDTVITGGPYGGNYEVSHDAAEALRVHWAMMHLYETGRFLCTTCNGQEEIECSVDVSVWGEQGLAGHTTEDWTEHCTDCEEGKGADEDICGMRIESGVLFGEKEK